MKVVLDPRMFRRVPLTELPALVAALGYEYIELSPREDLLPFFTRPRASRGPATVRGFAWEERARESPVRNRGLIRGYFTKHGLTKHGLAKHGLAKHGHDG